MFLGDECLMLLAALTCKRDVDVNIDTVCTDVHSDNPLHSMFRKEPKAGPVRCPFGHPPYTFSYNKGTGECQSPVSRIDSCMDSSRLLIRNAACADVLGTQDLGESVPSPVRNGWSERCRFHVESKGISSKRHRNDIVSTSHF